MAHEFLSFAFCYMSASVYESFGLRAWVYIFLVIRSILWGAWQDGSGGKVLA